jgi:hypothetical protein
LLLSLNKNTGDIHLDIKLDFKYCDYLRALENETLLSKIGSTDWNIIYFGCLFVC